MISPGDYQCAKQHLANVLKRSRICHGRKQVGMGLPHGHVQLVKPFCVGVRGSSKFSMAVSVWSCFMQASAA